MLRDIIVIDEAKCDGCGLCEQACVEGAIRVIDGKARLVSEVYCDGLGVCLGHCPQGAITIEKREAQPFDEEAVKTAQAAPAPTPACPAGGCPSQRFQMFSPEPRTPKAPEDEGAPSSPHLAAGLGPRSTPVGDESPLPSQLTHWPVQLRLLSPAAPVFRGADLLIAADCVPVACADFQQRILRGRAVAIACPKLDDTSTYVEKLAELIRLNRPASITVARMEVPCCGGILRMVLEARQQSGVEVPVTALVVSVRGQILSEEEVQQPIA